MSTATPAIPPATVRDGARGAWTAGAHIAVVLVALGLWVWSLGVTSTAGVAGHGLLDVLPAQFYVALGLLCIGFAWAACAPRADAPVLVLYTLALVAVLHLTSAILFELPRYTWTYKHFGPIALIGATGRLHPSVDIYNNWPGFFALNAWLTDALHIPPLVYARWAEPLLATGAYAAVVFALRGFTTDARRILIAGWLFVAADWVGQDYFAPQAVGFILALVLLGLGLGVGRPPASRSALALQGVCWAALVTTHQLSPIVVLGWFVVLVLLSRGVPSWVLAVMAVTEVAVIAHAWTWLSPHVDLFAPELFASARPKGFNGELALGGVVMARDARLAVGALVVALALIGVLRRRREGRQDLALLLLPVVPVGAALAQRYGGEGPLRAYLFALPFLALLAVDALAPGGVLRRGRLLVVAVLLAAAAPMAFFALELTNRARPEDVRTAFWVQAHVPAASTRVYIADSFIDVGFRQARKPGTVITMSSERGYLARHWGGWTVARLDRELAGTHATPAYVIVTPGQAEYLRMYGLVPPGSAGSLAAALERDPRFAVVHRDGEATVFRWTPSG